MSLMKSSIPLTTYRLEPSTPANVTAMRSDGLPSGPSTIPLTKKAMASSLKMTCLPIWSLRFSKKVDT